MFDRLRSAGFDVEAYSHAEAILAGDFPEVVDGLADTLGAFHVSSREIIGSGGGQATSTQRLRDSLYALGWPKHEFVVQTIVDGREREAISHEIDHVHRAPNGTLALEIEWNNKDPFFDRDLENFQRLHAGGAISLGIVVTRGAAMQARMADIVEWRLREDGIEDVAALAAWGMKDRTARQRAMLRRLMDGGAPFARAFAQSFVSDKYGRATTHWDKLAVRVRRGVGNPCPLLLVGLPLSAVTDYAAAHP